VGGDVAVTHRVTLIPGDGVGPELVEAAVTVLAASGVSLQFELREAGAAMIELYRTPLPPQVLDSIRSTGVALKGPVTTPVGSGFRSVNVTLRTELGLYASLRPARSLPGAPCLYPDVDLVIVRENTEDLYTGRERMIDADTAESVKVITRSASERVARFAFDYARVHGRRSVTAVHKANIMKLSDGLFLESVRTVAADYPDVHFQDRIVDNMCLQLVRRPQDYDVLVLPNLYGDIVSDLAAGLVGGLGLAPGANIGEGAAVFEAVHGSAPDIAGKDQVNPAAFLLSSAMMLDHLGESETARRIERAVADVLVEARHTTRDVGGTAGTQEMAHAVARRVEELS
jgi:isocitrate dehydrogenase (NAD+)